jgi:hypothetical protein
MSTKPKIDFSGVLAAMKKSTTLAIAPAPTKVPESALALAVREAPSKMQIARNEKGKMQITRRPVSRRGQDVSPDWYQVDTPDVFRALATPVRRFAEDLLENRLGSELKRMAVATIIGGKDRFIGIPKGIANSEFPLVFDNPELLRGYIAAGILKVADEAGTEADDSVDWFKVITEEDEIAAQLELLKKGGEDVYIGIPKVISKGQEIELSEEQLNAYIAAGIAQVVDVGNVVGGFEGLDDSRDWLQADTEEEDEIAAEIAAQQELFKKGGRNIYIGIPKYFLEGEGEELELDVDDVNQHILEGTVKVVDIGKLAGGLKALKAADDSIEWFQLDLLERTPTNSLRSIEGPALPPPPTPEIRTGVFPGTLGAKPRGRLGALPRYSEPKKTSGLNQMSYLMN